MQGAWQHTRVVYSKQVVLCLSHLHGDYQQRRERRHGGADKRRCAYAAAVHGQAAAGSVDAIHIELSGQIGANHAGNGCRQGQLRG